MLASIFLRLDSHSISFSLKPSLSSKRRSKEFLTTFNNEIESLLATIAFLGTVSIFDLNISFSCLSCANCSLFQGKATDAYGGCTLFGDKQVAARGWCSSYSNM